MTEHSRRKKTVVEYGTTCLRLQHTLLFCFENCFLENLAKIVAMNNAKFKVNRVRFWHLRLKK